MFDILISKLGLRFLSTAFHKMFICGEKEEMLLKSSSPVGSSSDSSTGLTPAPMSSGSPLLALRSICTDVNVVPEHTQTELHQSILNLEGEVLTTSGVVTICVGFSWCKNGWIDLIF